MSPQDVAVLLKIASYGKTPWKQQLLAEALHLSQSEVSKSLARSKFAGLLDAEGKSVHRQALLEFLEYGISYAFPVQPGPIVRGVPTAHSAPPMNTMIQGDGDYVWPSAKGQLRGQAIVPLYKNADKAAQTDAELHTLLGLVDSIRVGRVREKQIAVEELKKRLC
jgi:DNA-binding Lrp family transcriptional regulator